MNGEGAAPPKTAPNHHQGTNTHKDAGRSHSTGDGRQTPEEDIRLFLDVIYGGGVGFCHVVYGQGWFRKDNGTLRHQVWSENRERYVFPYPDDDDAIIAKILELAACEVDVYVATSPMRSTTSRRKQDVESLWCLHLDLDNGFNGLTLDDIAELGWCAVASGTPGHYHLYVPLSEPVTEAQFKAMQNALVAHLGADAKKAGNDVLRPPWTRNFKPTLDGGAPLPVSWAVRP